MADDTPADKRPKRRLKAPVETIRQRQLNVQSKTDRPAGRVSRGWRALGWPIRKFGGLNIWQTKAWRPFRFVGHWVGLVLLPPYIRNSFGELKRVTWPDWRQSWRLTFAVLGFAAVFGILIAGVDFGLDKLFKEVLLK